MTGRGHGGHRRHIPMYVVAALEWLPMDSHQMCEGVTDKQLHIRQMVRCLNLRSPDLLNHVN